MTRFWDSVLVFHITEIIGPYIVLLITMVINGDMQIGWYSNEKQTLKINLFLCVNNVNKFSILLNISVVNHRDTWYSNGTVFREWPCSSKGVLFSPRIQPVPVWTGPQPAIQFRLESFMHDASLRQEWHKYCRHWDILNWEIICLFLPIL